MILSVCVCVSNRVTSRPHATAGTLVQTSGSTLISDFLRLALGLAARHATVRCGVRDVDIRTCVHGHGVHVAHAMDHGCSRKRNLRSHKKCSRDKLKHSPPTALYERFAVRSLTAERPGRRQQNASQCRALLTRAVPGGVFVFRSPQLTHTHHALDSMFT